MTELFHYHNLCKKNDKTISLIINYNLIFYYILNTTKIYFDYLFQTGKVLKRVSTFLEHPV